MRDANCRFRFVDMLSAGTAGTEHVHFDVFRTNVHFHGVVDFRHDFQSRERGMPAAGGVERRHTHQTMYAGFRLQEAIGVIAGDHDRRTFQTGFIARVSRDSSGGENQAPFYVAICASLLQIYEKSENSIRLVLLDEAFSKMTSDRIRPMMELFRRMQLQVLLISTVEKSTAIQPYCDITYSIVRHGDVNAIAPFYRLNASEEIGS